jgi:peptide-methionine (R)-S-oxide reductase
MNKFIVAIVIIVLSFVVFRLLAITQTQNKQATSPSSQINIKTPTTDIDWKQILSPLQYNIMREAGTETPYTGTLLQNKANGYYTSPGCNKPLFSSLHKYDSGTGWPSFYQAINPDAIVLKEDTSIFGEIRTEVLDTCGNHLGHVFGERFCINSAALEFVEEK